MVDEDTKKLIRKQFWDKLKPELAAIDFLPIADKAHVGSYVMFRPSMQLSPRSKYVVRIPKEGGIEINFYLDQWKDEEDDPSSHNIRKDYFSKLLAYRKDIDEDFGEGLLIWGDADKGKQEALYSIKTKAYHYDCYERSQWPEIFEIVKDLIQSFRDALQPRLIQVEQELEQRDAEKEFSQQPRMIQNVYHCLSILAVILVIIALTGYFYLPLKYWLATIVVASGLFGWVQGKLNGRRKGMNGFSAIFLGSLSIPAFYFIVWVLVTGLAIPVYELVFPAPPTAEEVERKKMKQRRTNCIIAARDAVRKRLSNPYSAKFSDEFPCFATADGELIQRGYVNAKNAYGGYAGRREFVATIKDGKVIRLSF